MSSIIANVVVFGLVLVAVIAAIRYLIKSGKSGGCLGGCEGCSKAQSCAAIRKDLLELKGKKL